jgi:hypothetical protein
MNKNPKYLLLVIALIMAQLLIQPSASAQMFNKGDAVINLGVGLGSTYSLAPGATGGIGLNASMEYGVYTLQKVGVFSAGGIFSWSHASADYYGYNSLSWNEFYFGARAAFHLTMLEVDNLDVYGGVSLGIRSHSEPVWVNNNHYDNHYVIDPFGGVFVGGRWYFTPGFGVFSELGYDVSWFKAGVSLRF